MANLSTGPGDPQQLGAKAVGFRNPTYQLLEPTWRKLIEVREGIGGFLDGTNLIAHPREWLDHTTKVTQKDANGNVTGTITSINPNPRKPSPKLKARRTLACYDNIASTIIDAKKSALFREQANRRVGDTTQTDETPPTPLEEWWSNVDGRNCAIDDFLQPAWDIAATFGHCVIYMDKPVPEPVEPGAIQTAAEMPSPFLRIYTPLDVPDWIEDEYGQIIAIKLLEAQPRVNFEDLRSKDLYRYRIVTTEYWALYNSRGELIEGGPEEGLHGFGTLPIAFLFAERRSLMPHIGQSVLDNPQHYVDLYNLVSELRELLRNQTFGILNIPLGTGQDAQSAEAARALLGEATGTQNVMFSALQAHYISPDASNVTAYHDEIERRLRTIYRLAGIQWEADVKGAEAKGSLVLKREDMNTRLSAYADELELTEYRLAELFYRATGGDAGAQQFEDADVTIHYPDSFDITPFDIVLQQAQSVLALNMPEDVLKAIRKSLLPKFLPNLVPSELKDLSAAIDAAEAPPTPQEQMQMRIDAMSKGMRVPTAVTPTTGTVSV